MKIKDFITTATITFLIVASLASNVSTYGADNSDKSIDMPAEVLRDKIRGGLLGQLLGNLNGLKHEMKYINKPGNVNEYTPALPEGARTDDDTDLEWVYIVAMQRNNTVLLPPHLIVQLWKQRINNRIWCSNQYARQLMDIGFQPPQTGSIVFNPWANFNISGQFICESFGLVAPAMPQTAARIGLNYTRVTIDSEPAQTTQLFTSMIATAFITDDIENILEAGLKAIDQKCAIRQIVNDVRKWHHRYPKDWRTTRRLIKEKYSKHGGQMRDRNGHELNTASTIAALLYGRGDFVKTLMTAFNFGWDADNNAATSGTIIGVIKGYRWMMQQNWQIVDRYHNTTRDEMPMDETITSFADRIIDLSERIIIENGGQRKNIKGQIVYQIPAEKPKNIAPLPNLANQIARLQIDMKSTIKNTITNENDTRKLAHAAYSAICLDLAQSLKQNYPKRWSKALDALNKYPKVAQVLFFHSPFTEGDHLRKKALTAGLKQPKQKIKIW
ncbi:MAG: ADP-ribosylglycohydrolase family protein [Planctomycetes bacterium]|nr:ADP-ribosylglycohydrolase family protein [Planctomycetota bacterium]